MIQRQLIIKNLLLFEKSHSLKQLMMCIISKLLQVFVIYKNVKFKTSYTVA